MNRLAWALACGVLALAGASGLAQSRHISENVDPYSGLRTLFLEVSVERCPEDPPLPEHDPKVHVLFTANQNADGTVTYFVTPELDRGYALNVHKKWVLDVLIDGTVGTWSTPLGSTIVKNYSGGHSYQHETIPYAVSPADLMRLSSAHMFQFRINGTKRTVQRCADGKQLRDLKEFLHASAEYATPAAIPPATPAPVAQPQPPQQQAVDGGGEVKSYSVPGIETYACDGDPAPAPRDAAVQLTVLAEQHPDKTVRYFFVTDLTHGAALNVKPKGTLDVEISGASKTYATPHGSNLTRELDSDGNSSTHETIEFHVDRRDVVALASAAAVELRIHGSDQTLRRCTDVKHLAEIAGFLKTTAGLYDHPVPDAK